MVKGKGNYFGEFGIYIIYLKVIWKKLEFKRINKLVIVGEKNIYKCLDLELLK